MGALVSYNLDRNVAVLKLDDGKANVMSSPMIAALDAALDRARADDAGAVVLAGRPGVFSGGFDLKVLKRGGRPALRMLRGGFELTGRLLAYPRPVVAACTGHAIAMGVFIVLSADHRVGAAGDFRLHANEVAIGLTMPRVAVEVCRQRLAPAHFNRAVLLSEPYTPADAVEAGFLDEVVAPGAVFDEALRRARALADGLDLRAHAQTKARVRAQTLRAIRRGISADMRDLMVMGARQALEAQLRRLRGRVSRRAQPPEG